MIRTTVTLLLGVLCATSSLFASPIDSPRDITLEIVGTIPGVNGADDNIQSVRSTQINAVDPQSGDFAVEGLSFGTDNSPIWQATGVSLIGNADPFVNLDFTITNLSASPADVTVSAVVPISGTFPGPNVLFGELEFDVVNTGGGDTSASLSSTTLGAPIFTGTVDGADALPIAAGSFSVVGGSGALLTFGPFTDTDPAFGTATTSIGIDIAFTLSPGDTAVVDSFFSLEPVPEPAAATLVLLGLSLTLRRSRQN